MEDVVRLLLLLVVEVENQAIDMFIFLMIAFFLFLVASFICIVMDGVRSVLGDVVLVGKQVLEAVLLVVVYVEVMTEVDVVLHDDGDDDVNQLRNGNLVIWFLVNMAS